MARADFPDPSLGPDEILTLAWQDTRHPSRPNSIRAWHLLVGAVVEVRREGKPIRTGLVDDVTACGNIIWIAADGFDSRTMIDKREGYQLAIIQALH